jgi:hypothetical protein
MWWKTHPNTNGTEGALSSLCSSMTLRARPCLGQAGS